MKNHRIWITIALALTILLALMIYFQSKENAKKLEEIKQIAKQLQPYEQEKFRVETEITKLERIYKWKIKGDSRVILFFDQMDHNLFEEVYPLLSQYGYKGVFVLKDGKLPGDEGMISKEQYEILLDNGWEAALGGNEEMGQQSGYKKEQWVKYLDSYIKKLKAVGLAVPKIYCYGKGEHQDGFDEILKEKGFTMVRQYDVSRTSVANGSLAKALSYIQCVPIYSGQSSVMESLINFASNHQSISISTRYVEKMPTDLSIDTKIDKYILLLDYLGELETENQVKVVTFTEYSQYQRKLSIISRKYKMEWTNKVKELNLRLDEIDDTIDKIRKKHNHMS